jgi:tetratricopeptide (TPR) repeat protein
MNALRYLLAIPLLVATLTPRAAPDPEALLREGNAAFERGDFVEAVALFEKAQERATDPPLVAFNLACARYQLAIAEDGSTAQFHVAAELFRCCLAPDDPRRDRALYGLGNCLLLGSTGEGAPDPEGLRAAVESYEGCLQLAKEERLRADARYNLQRARLLLAQVPPEANPPDDAGSDEEPKDPEPPEDRSEKPEPGRERSPGSKPDERSGATPIQPQPGDELTKTDAPPAPGKGTLPPVPDKAEPSPLTAAQAAEHLRRATRRILEERQAYRKGRARPAPAGVHDW